MERYFNTLKNEYYNLHEFHTEEALYQGIEEFAYAEYNHVRPHSYNNYRTPYEARNMAWKYDIPSHGIVLDLLSGAAVLNVPLTTPMHSGSNPHNEIF